MKLNQFQGGLNTRLAPELISSAEAVLCTNVDNSSGQVASLKGLSITPVTNLANPYFSVSEDAWFADADTNDYLDYQGQLYWTDGVTPKKRQGTENFNLGIEEAAVEPTVAIGTGTGLTGTYQYVYTYYNLADGTESQPSPVSAEIVASNQAIDVTVVASSDLQVTKIFVYRVGGALSNFTKVIELANANTTFTDTVADVDVPGPSLTSELNGKAPATLRYLGESQGIFFGAVNDRLYYSLEGGNPNYWPEVNYLNFSATITGLKGVANGLLVCTRYETYLVTGNATAGYTKRLISGDQGCINFKTMAARRDNLFWLSTDGLCTLSGTTVQVISKDKLGPQLFNALNAVVFDEAYYCQLSDGTTLVFDLRYSPNFKYYDFSSTWLSLANDKLYATVTGNTFECFVGADLTLEYQTGNLTYGAASHLKTFNRIYLALTGVFLIEVYIDGLIVSTHTVTGAAKPIKISIPSEETRGTSISLKFTGTGTIKEFEIIGEGRKNGK